MFEPLVAALGRLTDPDLPAVALIGGMAVNIRLSTAADAHRVTQDIDLVADEALPTAVDVLASDAASVQGDTVVTGGVQIQVIETQAITEADLAGLSDDDRLFVGAHRWALETATGIGIKTSGRAGTISVPVATPAGLVATKSHAAGYPRSGRRATKHGGDLYDIFRLVEVFDAQGDLGAQLAAAPSDLGSLVRDVVVTELLANPSRTLGHMRTASSSQLDVERLRDVIEPFAETLE